MLLLIRAAAVLLCVSIYLTGVEADLSASAKATADPPKREREGGQVRLEAQAKPAQASGALDGKAVFGQKCFQCHQPSMFTSLRQDRKAWESTLYRMVGRGALWTEAEINAMADFLAQTRGLK